MMQEKRFTKYDERGNHHWNEEFGNLRRFNLVQHSRFETVLRYLPSHSPTILDWGCGDGALSYHLLARCDRLTGTDTEETGLQWFRKNLEKYQDSFELLQLPLDNAYHIDRPDHSFDSIVCSEVIEHVQSPERMVAEFARLLKPGGTVVITTPYRLTETPNDPMHVHEFYPSELRQLLQKHFPMVVIHLNQKTLFYDLYTFSIRGIPVFRYLYNFLFRTFRYNPFAQDETTKSKWDFFTQIIAVARS